MSSVSSLPAQAGREGSLEVAPPLAVVIVGSFRRGQDELRRDYAALGASDCEVLSPLDINFVHEQDGFVYAAHERHRSVSHVEAAHLDAIRRADFVWLHAPSGYVGPSGAFELGIASAGGVPVFAREEPRDVALREFVRVVGAPAVAAAAVRAEPLAEPGAGVTVLQSYYDRVARARGWASESAIESIVLLTEEVGELARAVREQAGLARRRSEPSDPSEELADVQLYVVHLANVLNVDLGRAVTKKERKNARRASVHRAPAQTA